jgi:hypothetical protein
MVRGLSGRVGRLENGQPEPCPECGWDGDWSKSEFVVEWDDLDLDDEDPSDPAEPRWCESCGHQWEYVVTWLDLEEKE